MSVGQNVHSLNIRVIVSPGLKHAPNVAMQHNGQQINGEPVNLPITTTTSPPYILDFRAKLFPGINIFEIYCIVQPDDSAIPEMESYALFINRLV